MNYLSSLLVAMPPALAALQETAVAPVDDAIKSIINLGVGGVIAVIFYLQWQREIGRREASEKRERELLRALAKVDREDDADEKPP